MRIIGFMVCGPNEKHLEKSLQEFKRLCDDAIIATNNADENTKKLITQYGYWQYEDNREWGKFQPLIKTDLLRRVAVLQPDWIIALDADERFAPEFSKEVARSLATGTEIAYYFTIVNLYNDEDHFAHDSGIQRFWNVRFYKYLPHLGVDFQKKALHCGLAPPYAYKYGWYAPYYVEHFGLLSPEDRARKAARYDQYDPGAVYKSHVYYDDLKRELRPIPFDRQGLLRKLSAAQECQPRKTPKII